MDNPNRSIDQDCNEFIDMTCEGEITIAPGVNTRRSPTPPRPPRGLQGAGAVHDDDAVTQPTFRFRIDGGANFNVQAGKCSPPKRVSVGNHTVTEVAENDYELDAARADGGIAVFPADREISRAWRPARSPCRCPTGRTARRW